VRGPLEATVGSVRQADPTVRADAMRMVEAKAKPPGSLGRLEELACRIAAIRDELPAEPLRSAVVVVAADHGVWVEGVSPYPQAVTGQMVANFASGGAAVSVLARQAGATLVVVDAGMLDPPEDDGVRSAVVDGVRGTANLTLGPAMAIDTATGLIERGIAHARELADDGVDLVAVGDMGIANTTAASALCAALLPAPPASVCGPGTGLDDAGVAHKVEVVRTALRANDLLATSGTADPVRVLASVGGLEIAYLVGVVLGAAACRRPVLLDGFVTGAAALVAAELAPAATDAMIAATRSPEPGHALVLERLRLEPLLDLGLRLGEGSGAALALPIVRAAAAILTEMATFEGAGVSRA
jgi:nicotinate-nucleotide--dimethylbenzimidazole phosphoribosyltransferase